MCTIHLKNRDTLAVMVIISKIEEVKCISHGQATLNLSNQQEIPNCAKFKRRCSAKFGALVFFAHFNRQEISNRVGFKGRCGIEFYELVFLLIWFIWFICVYYLHCVLVCVFVATLDTAGGTKLFALVFSLIWVIWFVFCTLCTLYVVVCVCYVFWLSLRG